MKKIFIIFFSILIILISGFIYHKYKPQENIVEEKNIVTISAEDIYEYKDDNPVKLNFYIYDNSGYHYVDKEISLKWNFWRDLVIFSVFATEDKYIKNSYMQDTFPYYWNKYENHSNYKIGYNLSFDAEDGHHSHTFINPSDTQDVVKFIQVYLYDDIAPNKGEWYSHLTDDQITNKTLMTSIKLFIAERYKEITSPLTVTVFTYDSDDDFDPNTHEYRGNSQTTVTIYQK